MKYLIYFENIDWEKREKRTIKRFLKASQDMSLSEAVDFTIQNCNEFIEYPFKMTRGITLRTDMPEHLEFGKSIFYSKPVKRWSRDNANWYNLIMDNHPYWKGFPKRQKSFMCSLRYKHVGDEEYLVVPIDGSKWGVASETDIFQSFKMGTKSIFGYSIDIDNFFNRLSKLYKEATNKELNDSNYKTFKNQLENLTFEKCNKETYFYESIKNFIEKCKDDNPFNIIVDIMKPEKNDIKIMDWKQIYDNMQNLGDFECWTDSPCLFIHISKVKKFINELEEKSGKNIYNKL